MRLLFAVALSVAATEQAQSDLTNLAALVVAVGTLVAGSVAYLRLRADRPKVVAEVAGIAETNLREELKTAWAAVDRLRAREVELEGENAALEVRVKELEREKVDLCDRVERLERIVNGPPIKPSGTE
jgi:predicted nuclease with TOPRIM domain